MVDGDEWKDKRVPGKTYHITARFVNEYMKFIDFCVVGIPEYPVFSKNGVTQMLSWRGIDRIEPVEECASGQVVSWVSVLPTGPRCTNITRSGLAFRTHYKTASTGSNSLTV